MSATTETAVERTLDDIGNAGRLVDRHGDDLRYVVKDGWYAWNGVLWERDISGAVTRKAIDTIDAIYMEAAQTTDTDARKALLRHASRSGSARCIRSMVELAEADLRVITTVDKLDRDPRALCVENGVIDLRTSTLREHRRADLITKLAPVVYDPEAQAPTFERFIAWAMQGDVDRIRHLQRAIGYTLTGLTDEQVLFILHGVGENGKSTLEELLADLLGDYAAATPAGFLLDDGRNSGPAPELLRLRGARFVAAAETGDGGRFDEPTIKRFTGGDMLAGRYMRSNEIIEFRPEFKLWLATNSLPRIREGGHAIWRRIRLLPFKAVIGEGEKDGQLPSKLRAELPGVLRWAVEGCQAWQLDGLGSTPEADAAIADYRASEDHIGTFLEDCCTLQSGAMERVGDLYAAYTEWAREANEEPLKPKGFGAKLERDYHLQAHRTGSGRWRLGVKLNERRNDA